MKFKMSRILIALIAALLLSTSSAVEPITAYEFAAIVANDLNGVLVDCPTHLLTERNESLLTASCYELAYGNAVHKSRLERYLSGFGDVEWITPWVGNPDVSLGRMVMVSGRDVRPVAFGYFLLQLSPVRSVAWITWLE